MQNNAFAPITKKYCRMYAHHLTQQTSMELKLNFISSRNFTLMAWLEKIGSYLTHHYKKFVHSCSVYQF